MLSSPLLKVSINSLSLSLSPWRLLWCPPESVVDFVKIDLGLGDDGKGIQKGEGEEIPSER